MDLKEKNSKNVQDKIIDLKKVDKRSGEYKEAALAVRKRNIRKMDKRSKAFQIWNALWTEQYGDAVEGFTDLFGIEKCDKCLARQKRWNKKLKEEGIKNQELVFIDNSILSDDAKLLLQAIWKSHNSTGQVDADLVSGLNSLYFHLYKRQVECSSCGFLQRFDRIRRL